MSLPELKSETGCCTFCKERTGNWVDGAYIFFLIKEKSISFSFFTKMCNIRCRFLGSGSSACASNTLLHYSSWTFCGDSILQCHRYKMCFVFDFLKEPLLVSGCRFFFIIIFYSVMSSSTNGFVSLQTSAVCRSVTGKGKTRTLFFGFLLLK